MSVNELNVSLWCLTMELQQKVIPEVKEVHRDICVWNEYVCYWTEAFNVEFHGLMKLACSVDLVSCVTVLLPSITTRWQYCDTEMYVLFVLIT